VLVQGLWGLAWRRSASRSSPSVVAICGGGFLALAPHHEDAQSDNPGLGGGGILLHRKWLAGFVARLADLFPSSRPGCELGRRGCR
jgi:hypothetical protein